MGAQKIPCLFFAEDSMLVCKTTTQACQNLKNLLDKFCQASAQPINFNKSIVIFSKNTIAVNKQTVSGIFNIP